MPVSLPPIAPMQVLANLRALESDSFLRSKVRCTQLCAGFQEWALRTCAQGAGAEQCVTSAWFRLSRLAARAPAGGDHRSVRPARGHRPCGEAQRVGRKPGHW